jgi:hypothetical protein
VDIPLKTPFMGGHEPAALGSEMRVVIGAVEKIRYTILPRSYSEETAHLALLSPI